MLFLFLHKCTPSRSAEAMLRQTRPPTILMAFMQLYVPEEEYRAQAIGARSGSKNHPIP